MISIICQFCIAKIRFENIVALAIFLRKAKSRRFRRAPEAGNGDFFGGQEIPVRSKLPGHNGMQKR